MLGLALWCLTARRARVFTKAGIHEITANTLACNRSQSALRFDSANDVRAEAGIPNSCGLFSAAPASLMIGNMVIGLERLDAILDALGIMLS